MWKNTSLPLQLLGRRKPKPLSIDTDRRQHQNLQEVPVKWGLSERQRSIPSTKKAVRFSAAT
jgi:hypothetical protein